MADVFSKEKRHEVMSRIGSENSKAELIAFRYLNRRKIYYQKHYSRISGKPDIALPRRKRAVFIDGDFWHGRSLIKLEAQRGKDDYWVKKIQRNVKRDQKQRAFLKESGWEVLTIWESDLNRKRTRNDNLCQIEYFLLNGSEDR